MSSDDYHSFLSVEAAMETDVRRIPSTQAKMLQYAREDKVWLTVLLQTPNVWQ